MTCNLRLATCNLQLLRRQIILHHHRRVIGETSLRIDPAIDDGVLDPRRDKLIVRPPAMGLAPAFRPLRPPAVLLAFAIDLTEGVHVAHGAEDLIELFAFVGQEA